MPKVTAEHKRNRLAEVLACPAKFAEAILRFELHPIQRAVLEALAQPMARLVVLCGNEVGKTARIVTTAVLWHLALYPRGQVVSTAGAWRQVTTQLIPNLHGQAYRFPNWRFLSTSISTDAKPDTYIGFSTTDQGRFQGYHNGDGEDEPLLMIVDEAAAVPDEIFWAAEDRCNPLRLLVVGSPLGPEGWFYDACTRHKGMYDVYRIRQTDCLKRDGYWLDDKVIQRKLKKWGKEHPLFLSNVMAEFSDKVEGAILSLREVRGCIDNPPAMAGNDRACALDFAAGGAENVVAMRHGNKVWIEKAWFEENTVAAVGTFLQVLNRLKGEYGLQACEVRGDADGMGIVFCDMLREAGWDLEDWHGGSKAGDPEYHNLIAECWVDGSRKIRQREVILQDDEELIAQLINRKSVVTQQGKVKLESKEDMAKRNVVSPDRADAILMAMMPIQQGRVQTWQDAIDEFEEQQQQQRSGMRGVWTG